MIKNGTSEFDTNTRLDSLKESVGGLVDAGKERAAALKGKAIEGKDAVVRGGTKAINTVGGLIKEHPIAAIGIAFGIGYLVMRLVRR
ncbi:MAG: hypothetical protein JWO36_79 [Myxococcales bacterium]|nr:hypothetical protein [Myxococcales bacterium]